MRGRFPSLNDILRVKASRWRGKWNAMKIEWQQLVRAVWLNTGRPVVHGQYRVEYVYHVSDSRRDLSNIAAAGEKIILDALVNAGAIDGDGFKHHVGSAYSAVRDTADFVEVTVSEKVSDSF